MHYITELSQILTEIDMSAEVIDTTLENMCDTLDRAEELLSLYEGVGITVELEHVPGKNWFLMFIDGKRAGHMFIELGHGTLKRLRIVLMNDVYVTDWYQSTDPLWFIEGLTHWMHEKCVKLTFVQV